MKTIYVVTQGSYSDYHICALFDTKEMAEQYIKTFVGGDGMEVEEYELNKHEKHIRDGVKCFCVNMLKDGTTTNVERYDHEPYWDGAFYPNGSGFCLYVYAKDEKHAIKIVNEKRVQLIANNTWGAGKGIPTLE